MRVFCAFFTEVTATVTVVYSGKGSFGLSLFSFQLNALWLGKLCGKFFFCGQRQRRKDPTQICYRFVPVTYVYYFDVVRSRNNPFHFLILLPPKIIAFYLSEFYESAFYQSAFNKYMFYKSSF